MGYRETVAIDGPAGAGKSTLSRMLAENLGYIYVDSGAFYRAITLGALEQGFSLEDEKSLVSLARDQSINFQRVDGQPARIYMNGHDVTASLRRPDVSRNVSKVAAFPGVREKVVHRLQKLAGQGCVVIDGRDIGTVVCPEARWKFFVFASLEERARRRQKELCDQGHDVSLGVVKEEIRLRDELDAKREAGPLVKALDAQEIDTTGRSPEEVLGEMLAVVQG